MLTDKLHNALRENPAHDNNRTPCLSDRQSGQNGLVIKFDPVRKDFEQKDEHWGTRKAQEAMHMFLFFFRVTFCGGFRSFFFLLLVLVQDSTLISIPNILSNTLLADRLLNVFTRLVRFHRLRDVNAHAAFEKASAFDALTGGSQ